MNHLAFSKVTQPEAVLSNYKVCSSANLDEVRATGTKILCENNLKLVRSNEQLDANIYYRQIGNIGFGRMSYGASVTISPAIFDDFFLIQMPIRGSEKISIGNNKILSSPSVFSIINSSSKAVIHHEANTEKLIIRIDKMLVEQSCQKILNRTLDKDVEFDCEMSCSSQTGEQWLKAIGWIFDSASSENSLSPLITCGFESMLVNMLLVNQRNNYSSEIHNDSFSVAPFFVKRVERYIEDNAHKPISIHDLADYAGVSSRCLFNGFRKYRNTTPMRHLKEVRLQHVHEELKKGCVGRDKVITFALNWGFSHLGHFATDYKRRFGETPYQTLMR